MPEPLDRSHISVVVDGKLIDYVERVAAYGREQELQQRLNVERQVTRTAEGQKRRMISRLNTLTTLVDRLLEHDLSPTSQGWQLNIDNADLTELRAHLLVGVT